MNDFQHFVVFTRSDRFPWGHYGSKPTLAEATTMADNAVQLQIADRAVVMEVGSVDAMPMFTFKYRAKHK